ncbi:hypothetical protein [Methylobacter sp.]|nr:hypothetical protein [Methylobacter sp.]
MSLVRRAENLKQGDTIKVNQAKVDEVLADAVKNFKLFGQAWLFGLSADN